MAQQTINVGAAPNDGTGTPLRTAFQYTNSNFSELYTAVGPSGNNIVVPGSATITGDLTVQGVGGISIGSASFTSGRALAATSPAGSAVGIRLLQSATSDWEITNVATAGNLSITQSGANLLSLTGAGVFTFGDGAGGTRMTLNSTGLGVGASPNAKLTVYGGGATTSTVNFSGGSAGSDNATIASNYNLNFQVDANNTVGGRAFIWRYGGKGYSDGTHLMTLDASGNLGIGVTPSAWGSAFKVVQLRSGSLMADSGGTTLYNVQNVYFDGSNWLRINAAASTRYEQSVGVHSWWTGTSGSAGLSPTFTQAMTLDASGNLNLGVTSSLINTTRRLSVSGTVAAALQSTGAATVETINVWHTATSGNNIFVDFDTEAAVTSRGSISYNRAGGLVAYNTTSDYRAKDIIGPVSNSGSLIDSLKVYVGKMKGATIERPMLIAHEAQEVAPYAVTGTKDEVDADGKPKYQQMDASALVPLLIAEIQSLRARVQTLETR